MTAANIGGTSEQVYLVNSDWVELWVNAGNDFRVTPFTDRLNTSNEDADVGNILCELQLALPALMTHGCTQHS
jgi:hypothetical protein